MLETFRECLQDVFDLPALVELARRLRRRELRVVTVDAEAPSPFAASLLFGYVANYIYDGDAPLAERRAQALAVDQAQLRELLGAAELRELLDAQVLEELELSLQALDAGHKARSPDRLHDLLLRIGDLTLAEIAARVERAHAPGPHRATGARRSAPRSARVGAAIARARAPGHRGGTARSPRRGSPSSRPSAASSACTSAARSGSPPPRTPGACATPSGRPPPPGLPAAFLEPVPTRSRTSSRATRAPTRRSAPPTSPGATAPARRRSWPRSATLVERGRVLEGEFRPGGSGREWCDADVLANARRRSLAKLRKQVEPAEPAALGRLLVEWQGVATTAAPRAQVGGPDRLLDVIEQLQGAAVPASVLETDVLPARLPRYRPRDLDLLCAAGEVVLVGAGPLGERDGRIALYLTDDLPLLHLLASPTRRTASITSACATTWPGTAPASSPSSSRRPAGRPAWCWTRSGTWSGPARSPTTARPRCARTSPARRGARPRAAARPGRSARAGRPRRARSAAGAWSAPAPSIWPSPRRPSPPWERGR